MASRRRTTSTAHEWTEFEKHTLLCLMAKGMHLEERGNRRDEPGASRQHAYLNVATELNKAVNGANGFQNDIDRKEVAKMIDRMLVEKKGVVGKGGYMERATNGRITRGLKKMWNREPSFDYNGSETEWKQWRKESETEKRRTSPGGATKGSAAESVVDSVEKDVAPEILGDIWRQAVAGSNRSGQLSNSDITGTPVTLPVAKPPVSDVASQELFNRLPAHLRGNEKYAWANPAASTGNRSSYADRPSNIDSSRVPSSSSASRRSPPYQSSSRRELMDSYRPSANQRGEGNRSSSYNPYSSNSNYGSSTRNERSSQDVPHSIHDYSTSYNKQSTYSGTARPTNTSYKDANLARTIQSDRTPGDKFNPERRAMLVEPDVEVEMGEGREVVGSARRGTLGKGANKEDLPFNRLERRGQGKDTEMHDRRY